MSLEAGSFIPDLVATNPVGATDFVSQGDDHIRLLKVCIQGSFPNLGLAAVTASAAELSILDGATLSVAELNILDGATLSVAELNILDGVTATTAEINKLAGTPAGLTSTEIGYLDGVTSAIQGQFTNKLSSTGGTLSGTLAIAAASPEYRLSETDQAADEIIWRVRVNSKVLSIDARDDANTAARAALAITRGTGVALTAIEYGNTTDLPTHTFRGPLGGSGAGTWTGNHTFTPTSGNGVAVSMAALGSSSVAGLKVSASSTNIAGIILQSSGKGAWQVYAAGAADELRVSNGTIDVLTVTTAGVASVYDGAALREVGYRHLPIVNVATTPLTVSATHNGKGIWHTNAGAATVNLPNGLTTGTVITIINDTSGNITLQGSGSGAVYWYNGVTRTGPATRTLAYGAVVTCVCLDGTAWGIWGSGIS